MSDAAEQITKPTYEMPIDIALTPGDKIVVPRSSGDLEVFSYYRREYNDETKGTNIVVKKGEEGKEISKRFEPAQLAELNRPIRTALEWQDLLDKLADSGGTSQHLSYGPGKTNESWTDYTPIMIQVVMRELRDHAGIVKPNDVTWEALGAIEKLQPKALYEGQ